MRPSVVVCDDTCGCPVPCPGGTTCRCATGGTSEDDPSIEHKRCSCGEHCSCNPCTCSKGASSTTATGKILCKCGEGCTCVACAT